MSARVGALLALLGTPEDAPPEPPWHTGAMVDVAYSINSNFPANSVNRGHATAPRTGQFALNYVAAYLQRDPNERAPFRFQLALHAGANVDATYAGEPGGAFAGAEAVKHVGLANVGLVSPWGKERGFRTEVAAGLFSSPITFGNYWSHQSWSYSSAWGNSATPYYLFGANVTQHLTERASIAAWIVNGWQTIGDVNALPSYMVSLAVEPTNGLTISENFYFGPEYEALAPEAWRLHTDTQVAFDREAAGVAVFADYGQEKRVDLAGDPVHRWAGAALSTRLRVLKFERWRWETTLRPEFWWESDGTFFGVPQTLVSASFTNTLHLWDHAVPRIEYRYDQSLSERGFFYARNATDDDDILAREQHTVWFSLVGYFDYAFGGKRPRASD